MLNKSNNKTPISTIIVVKDELQYLKSCVQSINDLSTELIIIPLLKEKLNDIKDATKIFKGKILIINKYLDKNIPFIEMIKEDLKKYSTRDWLFYLDPDEIISRDLKKYIKKHIEKCDYFSIPRKNIIFGKWIKHSRWWPDYQVRLYKKKNVVWPAKLHAVPKVKGRECKVPPQENLSIIHYNYDNVDHFLSKAIRYAKNDINYQSKPDSEITDQAVSELISRMYAFEGYKDGQRGVDLSLLQMFYYFLVLFYKHEKRYYKEVSNYHKLLNDFFVKGLKNTIFWQNKKLPLNKRQKIKYRVILKLLNLLCK